MARLLVRNGFVVDPSQNICEAADVLIEDGTIIMVAPKIRESTDRVLEARGMMIFPGLVDMHVHLRDPGQTHKEDIYTGCNAAVSGGITSILCMPNTAPPIDSEEIIDYIEKTSSNAKAKMNICGCMTKGLEGSELCDFAMYKKHNVAAVSDDGKPVKNKPLMKQAMQLAKENGLVAISHCEDLDIVAGGIIHKGEVSEKLQVAGIDRLSEDTVTEREIKLAKENNLAVHIAHVSTKKSVELIRQAKKDGVRVTCETCPHYFVYTHEKLLSRDADFRMNPPLREQEDVDAVIEGIKDGTIDCIVTDHAPHSKKEKESFEKAPNGVVGMETSLSASMTFLVEKGHISVNRLIELVACNPARILGLNVGTLKEGAPADLTLFDATVLWTVLPERLNSKSKNSAFKFEKLKGRVKYTLVNGEIVYVLR